MAAAAPAALVSYQASLAGELWEWWEDSWQRRIGPRVVLVKVPGKWGRTTVFDRFAAGFESAQDAPVTIVIRISGRVIAGGTGLQAQILRGLLADTWDRHREADLFGLDSAAGRIQFGLSVGSLFVAGPAAAPAMFLAGVAAGVAGKIWDDSLAGREGAVATAARFVADVSTRTPVVVVVDDAEDLDVGLALVLLQNLVSRSDGQILIVVAASSGCEMTRMLTSHDLPPALVPAVKSADVDPDMSYTARGRLAKELCPVLPRPVTLRIGQRTRTFADVFAIVNAGRLTGLTGDPATLLPAVDKVIDTALARLSPSPEAVIVAWAGGLAHPRQASDGLGITGAAPVPDDPDLIRARSLVRLADPDRQRYTAAILAMADDKPALARVCLDDALAIQGDASCSLAEWIVAGMAAHRVRADLATGSAAPLMAMQCQLVTSLEQSGDHRAAFDIASESLAECPSHEDLARQREQLKAVLLRLASRATAAPDPQVADLISQALASGATAGIESRVWAAVNLLQARENEELALSLIGQIHTDLSRVNDWGSADAAWRLTLGFHAG